MRSCALKFLKNKLIYNQARHAFAPHRNKIVTEKVTAAAKDRTTMGRLGPESPMMAWPHLHT
jgi:hypothetical protein